MKLLFSLILVASTYFAAVMSYQRQCSEEGEEYRKCGTACPLTCEQPEHVACTLQCVEGCYCKEGLFRDTTSNRCVTIEECNEITSGYGG